MKKPVQDRLVRVLVIDDLHWISVAKSLIEPITTLKGTCFEVSGYGISSPGPDVQGIISKDLISALENSDAVLVARLFCGQISSTPLIGNLRRMYPRLMIIRWEMCDDNKSYMRYLCVNKVKKPTVDYYSQILDKFKRDATKPYEEVFQEAFKKALIEQTLIHGDPKAVLSIIDEEVDIEEEREEIHENCLGMLAHIARLAHEDEVLNGLIGISGKGSETALKILEQCLFGGNLSDDDVSSYFFRLQKAVARIEKNGIVSDRHRETVEMVKHGDPKMIAVYRSAGNEA